MTNEEQEVIYAAIKWYKEVLRQRDKLSKAETKLFYCISLLENSQVTKLPSNELYDERNTTPVPSILMGDLLKRSKDKDGN